VGLDASVGRHVGAKLNFSHIRTIRIGTQSVDAAARRQVSVKADFNNTRTVCTEA